MAFATASVVGRSASFSSLSFAASTNDTPAHARYRGLYTHTHPPKAKPRKLAKKLLRVPVAENSAERELRRN
jgi:hypothetical protein